MACMTSPPSYGQVEDDEVDGYAFTLSKYDSPEFGIESLTAQEHAEMIGHEFMVNMSYTAEVNVNYTYTGNNDSGYTYSIPDLSIKENAQNNFSDLAPPF